MTQTAKPKKKKRRLWKSLMAFAPLRWALQAYLWLVVQLVFSFGPRWAYFWARRIASFMWLFFRRQRNMALRNVDLCLPELPEAERRRIARKSFDHVIYAFFDMLLLPRVMGGERWKKYVTIGQDVLDYHKWAKEGAGPITISGHFGSWEVGAHVNSCFGFHQAAIYRPLDLPYFDRLVRRMRAFSNVDAIEKEGGLRQLLRKQKEKQPLLALLDQYGGDDGLAAPFFGVPARWQTDVLAVLKRHGLKLCVSDTYRHGDEFKFTYRALAMKEFPPEAELSEIVNFYASTMEKFIREHPEQYFWLHRRFKSKGSERDLYADLDKRLTPEMRAAMST